MPAKQRICLDSGKFDRLRNIVLIIYLCIIGITVYMNCLFVSVHKVIPHDHKNKDIKSTRDLFSM